jgi:rubrerythrin
LAQDFGVAPGGLAPACIKRAAALPVMEGCRPNYEEVVDMAEPFMNTPPKPEKLGAMTEEFIKTAFAGESQASQKYLAFAAKAREEGLPNVARLFEAVAFAESTHARNHLSVLGGIGGTLDNLGAAFGGETFEIDEMYPAYDTVAKMQGASEAVTSIRYAKTAEQDHQAIYEATRATVQGGADLAAGPIHVCPICGHTVIGDAPAECPVCGTHGQFFRAF